MYGEGLVTTTEYKFLELQEWSPTNVHGEMWIKQWFQPPSFGWWYKLTIPSHGWFTTLFYPLNYSTIFYGLAKMPAIFYGWTPHQFATLKATVPPRRPGDSACPKSTDTCGRKFGRSCSGILEENTRKQWQGLTEHLRTSLDPVLHSRYKLFLNVLQKNQKTGVYINNMLLKTCWNSHASLPEAPHIAIGDVATVGQGLRLVGSASLQWALF